MTEMAETHVELNQSPVPRVGPRHSTQEMYTLINNSTRNFNTVRYHSLCSFELYGTFLCLFPCFCLKLSQKAVQYLFTQPFQCFTRSRQCFLYMYYTATAVCRSTSCIWLSPAPCNYTKWTVSLSRALSLSVICYKPEPETRVLTLSKPETRVQRKTPGFGISSTNSSRIIDLTTLQIWLVRLTGR